MKTKLAVVGCLDRGGNEYLEVYTNEDYENRGLPHPAAIAIISVVFGPKAISDVEKSKIADTIIKCLNKSGVEF